MNDRLMAAIGKVDAQLTVQQWADALWLARFLPFSDASGEDRDHLETSAAPAAHPPRQWPRGQEGDGERAPEGQAPADPVATLHLPAQTPPDAMAAAGPFVQVPSVPALPETLSILRALRPLRMSRPSRHKFSVDETATVSLIANCSIWTPVLRPSLVRRFDLAVVVDVSQSMVIWQRTISEFHSLLQHLGAFHSIEVWQIDSAEPGVPLRRSGLGRSGPVHSPAELTDPADRKVILVVSDCVGAGWRDGSMAARLETWASSDPVAIIQLLPQRMWRRCGPEFTPVSLSSRRLGMSNAELTVTTREGTAIDPEQGLAVPVLELDPRWLEPWSRLMAGNSDPISMMAMFTRARPRRRPVETVPRDELDATQKVYSFRNTASPVAFDLAAFLAATPLSLPVIRLVQNAMLPESRPAHLAEFFLGGLIYRVGSDDDDPDNVLYEFHAGVRDLLLTRLRRSDTLRVLHQVAEYISLRFGTPRDFRAILAEEQTTGLGIPFARILRQVLTALGGSYAAFAAMMHRPQFDRRSEGEVVEIVPATRDIERDGSAVMPVIPSRDGASDPDQGGPVSETDGRAIPERTLERPPAIFEGVPTRNPHFTGRESLLDDLKNRLSSSETTALVPQALHGLGGVGKTQLAVEYCHRFAHDYDLVLWIPAEQPSIARTTLAQLAEKLQLPRYEDQSQAVDAVLQTLRRGEVYDRWILVFDNADRPEDLGALMPDIQGPGHILITSRNQRWSDRAKVLEVDVFTRPESIDLLERRCPGMPRDDADRLAEKLGDLPLALEQAAAWQAETGMPVAEYLSLLDERMEQLLEVTSPLGNYPTSVAATWRIAFERLTTEAPISLELLELCAFFGAEPIANQLMPMGRFAPSLSSELRRTVADSIELGRAIRHLGRYALAKVDHPTNSVQVHRLVQAVLREKVGDEQAVTYRRGVQEILAAYNPGDPDNRETWPLHAKIAPHIIASGAVEGSTGDIRRLILDHVQYLQRRGYFRDSAEVADLAYQRWREDGELGPDHVHTLICGRLLAISLRWIGENDRAREINQDTLDRLERVFPDSPNHEHILITANSYGADLRLAGKLKEARDLGKRTYEAQLSTFGEDDIRTLNAANNRALDLKLAGRFREATELDEKTLATLRRVHGEGEPFTLLSYMNLGCDFLYTGRYQEAKRALQRAIDGYERIFAPDHIPLLLSYRFLGVVLRRMGDFQGSYDNASVNVQRYERRLGSGHEQTLTATMSLCNAMRALGQTSQSSERSRQLLEQYRDLVGPSHPLTLACAANLAITLRQTGELQEARQLDEVAIVAFNEQLGKEHPSSLSVGNNLANDLYRAGDHAGALRLSQTTLERSRAIRGTDNAYTLAAAANHVIDLRTAGHEEEARTLEIDTWHRYRALLGERHPDTIAAMSGIRIDAEIDPPPY